MFLLFSNCMQQEHNLAFVLKRIVFLIVLTFSTSTWIQSILVILLYSEFRYYLTLLRSMLFQSFPSFHSETFCAILRYCIIVFHQKKKKENRRVDCFVYKALSHSKFNVGCVLRVCVKDNNF